MATLNFDHASKFSISGGIFSPARHVTMISGGDPSSHTWYRGQGRRRRGRRSSSSRGSKRRPRAPSPTLNGSSSGFTSLAPGRQTTPPTFVEHQECSFESIPQATPGGHDTLSPLSGGLGAMHGLTTPVTHRSAMMPSTTGSPDVVVPVIPRPSELSVSSSSAVPDLHRLPRAESFSTRSTSQLRPLGPRPYPLQTAPRSSRFSNAGTSPVLPSVTGSCSHTPASTSWPSSQEQSPSLVVSPVTYPSTLSYAQRPHQPIPFSRRSVQSNRFPPSYPYATNDYPHSPTSSSQAFSASAVPEVSFSERVTSRSRYSVQNSYSYHPFRHYPVPPRASPHHIPTTHYSPAQALSSRNYFLQPSHQAPRSPPSFLRPIDSSEMNTRFPLSHQYLSSSQNSSHQHFIHTFSPGISQRPQRSPYIEADLAHLPHVAYLPSRETFSYHTGSYNDA